MTHLHHLRNNNPQHRPKRRKYNELDDETHEIGANLKELFQEFVEQLPSRNDADNMKEIHKLFEEGVDALHKLTDRVFKIRMNLIKKGDELRLLMKSMHEGRDSKLRKELFYGKLHASKIPHPIINEQFQTNILKIERSMNYLKTTEHIKALRVALEITNRDIKCIIERIAENYKKFIGALQHTSAESKAAWCTSGLIHELDPIVDDSAEQIKLFVNMISKYRQTLEIRFSELEIQNHLALDYCQKWRKRTTITSNWTKRNNY